MKRYGNLYDKLCEMDNLILAEKNARKGKTNTYGIRQFDKNREENLKALQKMLIEETYQTSPYKTMTIYEPKERLIYRLPYYPDRIVHHAVMNILEPIWVKNFTADSYANIKGRGIHACAEKLKQALNKDSEGTRYCLKLDIRKYYSSVDHELLKTEVRRTIKDKKLLRLLNGIIDSEKGLPIGNYLSQYFANVFLSRFDHRMKEVYKADYYFQIC